eukprot:TRINITY_DN6611_c0_g1_i1.p1 TRINITY_DN6611_c0_g1~~TRINITY_DN6611_c0_g1_i1.p1  ORF type:complete len:703 (+),score=103.74 TRINITY_DN6611_c0_g1_i1:80-2188(+)
MTDTNPACPAPPLTIVDLPLELIGAITDELPKFDDRAQLMLTCRRLHHGVIASKCWRIVKEVVASTNNPGFILRRRETCLAHAAHGGLDRLLRFLAPVSTEEAYCCLPLACAAGNLDMVRKLIDEFSLTRREMPMQSIESIPLYSKSMEQIVISRLRKYHHLETKSRFFSWPPPDPLHPKRTFLPSSLLGCLAIACSLGDLPMLEYICTEHEVTELEIQRTSAHVLASNGGHLPVLRFLQDRGYPLTVVGNGARRDVLLRAATRSGCLDVFRYMHEMDEMDVTVHDVHDLSLITQLVVERSNPAPDATENRLELLMYIHTEFGIDPLDIVNGDVIYHCCFHGHIECLRYVHDTFHLTADDARVGNNGALWQACRYGHLPILEYLHTGFGLTVDDVRDLDVEALRLACMEGHLPIVKYLHTAFNLTADDARCEGDKEQSFFTACLHNQFEVMKYLFEGFGLKREDARDYGLTISIASDFRFLEFFCTTGGLTTEDLRTENCQVLFNTVRSACCLEQLRYLFSHGGLTVEDARTTSDDPPGGRANNYVDPKKNSVLLEAVRAECVEAVQFLRTIGLNGDDVRADNYLVLREAFQTHSLPVVRCLFEEYGLTKDDLLAPLEPDREEKDEEELELWDEKYLRKSLLLQMCAQQPWVAEPEEPEDKYNVHVFRYLVERFNLYQGLMVICSKRWCRYSAPRRASYAYY